MRAVGLTDHGTFAGAIDFLKTCRANKIKPILGMETYLARDHKCHDKQCQPDGRKGNRHLNIIAKNYKGFQNLCALSQAACLDGYYYDPRVDFELLAEHREGLIVTSACLSSVVNWNLSRDRYERARAAAAMFKDIFGDDFYLEVMFHGIDAEGKILPDIQKLASDVGVKMLATNDCHYIEKADSEYHEYLMCMSSGRTVRDPKRIKFPYSEFYFKSPEEMNKIFGHVPTCLLNTIEVAEKCDYSDLIFVEDGGEMKLPKFEIPEQYESPHDYLERLGREGMKALGMDKSPPHVARFEQEVSDLRLIWDTNRYDFATYLLMIEDIMRFAKKEDISAGIRGSGYGSLLVKALGISEGIDPLEQDLMWERFLGFDSKMFISEADVGIKEKSKVKNVQQEDSGKKDATEIMFDRYV